MAEGVVQAGTVLGGDFEIVELIASGGMASLADIDALRTRPGAPIAGAVLGKALYTGAIRPAEALSAARRTAPRAGG